jgi:hypothetical protein
MRADLEYKCNVHQDRYDCPDALVVYTPKFDEYGLIIHDGASSSVTIQYCPWCGAKLPESKHARWFDELERLGIVDPEDQRIPSEFTTDEWYRKR